MNELGKLAWEVKCFEYTLKSCEVKIRPSIER